MVNSMKMPMGEGKLFFDGERFYLFNTEGRGITVEEMAQIQETINHATRILEA